RRLARRCPKDKRGGLGQTWTTAPQPALNRIAWFYRVVKRNLARRIWSGNGSAEAFTAARLRPAMMIFRESYPDVKPRARRRIFLRIESLRNRGHARASAALRSGSSPRVPSSAWASLGDRYRRRALPRGILRGQDSLPRHGLGLRSHVHSAARRSVACLRGH